MTAEVERRLVESAAKGNEMSFEELVRANQGLVYNVALKLTGNREDALDVSQEAFIKAYKNLSSFRFESRFSAWLYRLTYNAAMDQMRKPRDVPTVSLTEEDEDDESQRDIPDPSPGPEERAQRRELQEEVRRAVLQLDEDKREVLAMREFSGMSYGAIAEALGIEEGTVKSRLSRARAQLAEILTENGTFSRYAASNTRKGGKPND